MMPTQVASFRVNCTAHLDASGSPIGELPQFARDRKTLEKLYSAMVKTRSFDTKAIALQRTGRLGTYASSLGQEAIGVGVASAMIARDVLLPSFREHGAQLWRGVSLEELFLYWGGDERGNNFAKARQDFPVCIPVASQFPHAAGVALAMVQKDENAVAVAIAGDGATSKGDFYEAMNVVGVWNLPAVFVINNNQWAISVPREDQSATRTLAQKAIAAGIPGEQVDGNDVIGVRAVMERALSRARAGKGGTLIECLSYRLGDHTTADDASRYREDEVVSAHWKEEPLIRLRNFLVAEHGWNKHDEEKLLANCGNAVEKAAENYLATAPQAVSSMFENLYGQLPADIAALIKEIGDA
jgi:2-oxoisovalerate dehydrogenase E1 component alpha subunit